MGVGDRETSKSTEPGILDAQPGAGLQVRSQPRAAAMIHRPLAVGAGGVAQQEGCRFTAQLPDTGRNLQAKAP